MHHFHLMSAAWIIRWLVACGLVMAAAIAAENDTRFSMTLTAPEQTESGVARLTSDQVAVLDALVRRDTATRGSTPAPKKAEDAAPSAFSKRLSADEQRNTGFTTLTATEAAKLDELIDRHQTAKLARSFLAPPEYLTPNRRVAVTEKKDERRVHGSFSLSYGFGKGGYSEKTGSMVVNVDDPDRGLSLSIGYSESHIKGGSIYRDPYYDYTHRDPFYDPTRRDPFYDPTRPAPVLRDTTRP